MSSASSLGMGLSALQAAQRGLEIAGQNISNVNTPGYTRQRIDQAAASSTDVPSMFGRIPAIGEGVVVLGTTRIQDQLLEVRAQQTRGAATAATQVANGYSMVESAFGEPGDTGLQAGMAEFWSTWGDLATDPTSSAARTSVLEEGGRLASQFRELAGRLSTQWGGTREALNSSVDRVNRLAQDVGDLNDAIRASKVAGVNTSELEDRRGQLIGQLGDVVGAIAQPMEDGTMTLTVGGSVLVSGAHVSSLAVSGPSTGPGGASPVSVVWAASGTPATVGAGEIGGMLTTLDSTIPTVMSRLDAVAASLASTVNAQQAAGYDATGATGSPFFAGTSAASLRLAPLTAAGVAASSAPPPASDGKNADGMSALSELQSGPDATYRDLVVSIGVQVQGASRRADVQTALAGQAESARLGVSSVSVDEEMVSLMGFQHAYEAAARFISAVDETLNTLMQMAR
ncbi:flagellar hook-associated protein FlgK [Phycicoccus sp. MAQZ13P-2]|uniref:flagellar hook-associated protein FlgK n=1 Tax=Phycicoccus mangrovi TaxID=2840470 RepID=UPI001BFFFE93|nr:flagellar hook-associated protein FlgK [Phycicoccus mangrovi]MBT9254934.1 flagellar hook-associated protein FlgK [Phycicoccus mangrovi]MBT9256069.1 flagellar hook-associated protein FlgK [Phycicoccus mangrovi]MBT9273918.1 flagellar hook-associated protein FlgK [Phycicoccus mangrovi]